MRRLCLEETRPEMVLAADVRHRNGRLLLAAGQALTQRALRTFRMWGVAAVVVHAERDRGVPDPVEAAAVSPEARARVDELFRHTDRSHPVIATLHRVAVQRLGGRLTEAALP